MGLNWKQLIFSNILLLTLSMGQGLHASPSNDNFANAQVLPQVNAVFLERQSVVGATMELGEPFHMGPVPQKSIWWKWQMPRHGNVSMTSGGSLVPIVILAAYQGSSVESLTLLAKGTNELRFPAFAGEIYYIAAAVNAEVVEELNNFVQVGGFPTGARIIPGNLLLEPSWEGTALAPLFWGSSGSISGFVNELSGLDGGTWPVLGAGAKIWQNLATIPGHVHKARFAYAIAGGCCGPARVRVLWDGRELGIAEYPENEAYWHWMELAVIASNNSSRITFENISDGRTVQMDAFSVLDSTAPPIIITAPSSSSAVVGGGAAFIVGARGTEPLAYQWFYNGIPLPTRTNRALVIDKVSTQHAGDYSVNVSNQFGSILSSPVSLTVQAPVQPIILTQPYGDTIPLGGFFNLSVAAAGMTPLEYQWYHNDFVIPDATNRDLTLMPVQITDAGSYKVLVRNSEGSVWSLPAIVVVNANITGGGYLTFRNRLIGPNPRPVINDVPVFDIDGVTRLAGANYVAQLYAGPSLEGMRAAGHPSPFQSGTGAGFFNSQTITLPNVPGGENAFCQVRVWDMNYGLSYEQARGFGGKFGKSGIIQVRVSQPPFELPPTLVGLQSFAVQAGLPEFTVGRIDFVERQHGSVLWSLTGQKGYRYLIEKSTPPDRTEWLPFLILTNDIGTVTFADSPNSASSAVFYRARILD